MRTLIRSNLDYLAGAALASFSGLSVLRSALGIGQVAYVAPIGLVLGIVLLKVILDRTNRLRSYELWFVGASVLLFGWLLMSVFWTASNTQYAKDALLVLGLLGLTCLVPFIVDENVLKAALATLVGIGSMVGVYVLNSYVVAGSLRGYSIAFGDFYLIVSKSIGTATVGITVYTIFADERRWWQFLVIPFLFVALALSLSRGALLFALVVVVLALFYALFREPLTRSSIGAYLKSFGGRAVGVGAVVGGSAALIAAALAVERTAVRLRRLISGGGASVSERLFLWRASWERIGEAPILGYGLGSSGLLIAADESTYPHNFLLQLWVDGGVGAVLLMLIIASLPILAFLTSDEKAGAVRLSLLGIYLYLVLDFSKSYNVYTGRLLFIFCALSISSFRKMEAT